MTDKDTSLLNRNFNMNLIAIFTLIGCTATFVWKGGEFANQISNQVYINARDIARNNEQQADMAAELKSKADKSELEKLSEKLDDYSRYRGNRPMRKTD